MVIIFGLNRSDSHPREPVKLSHAGPPCSPAAQNRLTSGLRLELVRVVGTAHQRPTLDMPEAERKRVLPEFGKLMRCDERRDRQLFR